MAIRKLKPITPGTRHYSVNKYEELTTDKPYKPLLTPLTKNGGRNNTGKITSRHRGGGHKRRYRIIDWKRNRFGDKANVETIEYDPNRSAFIALVSYKDGEKRYILCPHGLKVGETLEQGPAAELNNGNALPLEKIPAGFSVHNIEMKPGKGGQLVRSAGQSAQVVGFDKKYAQVKLPSGEIRLILKTCYATLGRVSNIEHENIVQGKAGRNIWRGKRPQTRGMAMNPVDHPMGGGEGRSKSGGGRLHPRSPWGRNAKGAKTRKPKNLSNKMIIRRRKNKNQGK